MERVYLALGSNLGERDKFLALARERLAALPDSRLLAASSIEETAPLEGRDQPPYLNQMLLLETALDPEALLEACRAIETAAGRVRHERWGSRTLDIDIVRFGEREMATGRLTIPHPGLAGRDFWRREIAEIERHLAETRNPR